MPSLLDSQINQRRKEKEKQAKKILLKAKNQHPKRILQYLLGKRCILYGSKEARKTFELNKEIAKYWGKKFLDPTFHSNSHGGKRYVKI